MGIEKIFQLVYADKPSQRQQSDAHTVAQAQHHNKAVGHQIAHHRNQPRQKSEQNQRISHRQRPPHQRQNHQQINRGQRGVDGGDADLRKKHIGKAAQQFIKAPPQYLRQRPRTGRRHGRHLQHGNAADNHPRQRIADGAQSVRTRRLQRQRMRFEHMHRAFFQVCHRSRHIFGRARRQRGVQLLEHGSGFFRQAADGQAVCAVLQPKAEQARRCGHQHQHQQQPPQSSARHIRPAAAQPRSRRARGRISNQRAEKHHR